MHRTRNEIAEALKTFVTNWSGYSGTERAGAQTFVNQLVQAYTGVEDPRTLDASHESHLPLDEGERHGFVDFYWPEVVLIEMKGPKESVRLAEHRPQMLRYWRYCVTDHLAAARVRQTMIGPSAFSPPVFTKSGRGNSRPHWRIGCVTHPRLPCGPFLSADRAWEERDKIEQAAREVVTERASACTKLVAMGKKQAGLTAVYNAMDDGAFADLRAAHTRLDEAVCKSYGWPTSVLDDRAAIVARLYELDATFAADPSGYAPFGKGGRD